jgi:putative SOS response-associated peptidase YedK
MCGRYTLTTPAEVVARVFGLGAIDEYPAAPRYNIAPTQMAPVIRVSHSTGQRVMQMMRWGLVPYWTKGSEAEALGSAARMINARAESLSQRPAYRTLLERRRCLIPADGFYEWLKPASSKDRKQPYAIRLKDDRVFAFAGLWDRWKNEKGEKIDSYTIITTQPNEVAGRYHDRMPVMLIEPAQWDRWLDESATDTAALKRMLVAPPDDTMRAYPVSPRVNSAVLAGGAGELNDDPGLLAELPPGDSARNTESLFD